MIEWEVRSKLLNRKIEMINVLVLSVIFLTMVVIFYGVITYFFSISDHTLFAGIIGFCGAVIGGGITLLGVNKTLNEQRRKEDIRALELKYFAIQEYILEIDDLKVEIGKLNLNIIAFYKSADYHDDRTLNDWVSRYVSQYSDKVQELRKNKEFIRKMEGVGFELYSRELSFLKDLNVAVLALIAVKDDLFSSAKLYEIAYENIGSVLEKLNEKYLELHRLKVEIRKEIRNF